MKFIAAITGHDIVAHIKTRILMERKWNIKTFKPGWKVRTTLRDGVFQLDRHS